MIARYLAGIIIGYFLGSIPWGVIITKRVAKVDVRQYGSGNIGATNVLRTAGWKVALLSGLLDVAKGAAAVLIAGLIVGKTTSWWGNLVSGRYSVKCWPAWPQLQDIHGLFSSDLRAARAFPPFSAG